jgi:molybdopterin-containing oxidoreductase family iron-sulfur binding subunit
MSHYTRREFISIAINSSALAAANIGSKEINKLIPYVIAPEEFRPGKWLFYNTTCRECPAGCGMYLRHQNGRVVKAEGNPKHPINMGGLCPRGQSCVQGLYDPDRLRKITINGKEQSANNWEETIKAIAQNLKQTKGKIFFISNLQTGTLNDLFELFLKNLELETKLIYWEPFNYEPQRKANKYLFDVDGIPKLNFSEKDLFLSFGADFLEGWISNVEWTKQFSQMHHKNGEGKFIYIGPRFSMTAANADEFIQNYDLVNIAGGMLKTIVQNGWSNIKNEKIISAINSIPETDNEEFKKLAKLFIERKGMAISGPTGSIGEEATKLAIITGLLNYAVGNYEKSIDVSQLHSLSRCSGRQELLDVFAGMTKDDVLIFHNCNPAYNLNGSAELISKAGKIIYLGVMPDETSRLADYVLPIDYYLESWGDYEPRQGIYSLTQPVMKPIYDTMPAGDILIGISKALGKQITYYDKNINNFYEMFKLNMSHISDNSPENIFINGWHETKINKTEQVNLRDDLNLTIQEGHSNKLKLWLWPSIMLYDGAVSNRGWLQENPEPVTQIGWGNFAEVESKTAKRFNLKTSDIIILKNEYGQIELPVVVSENISEGAVSVYFGQGHSALGRNAKNVGANAFELLGKTDNFFGNAEIIKTGKCWQPVKLVETDDQNKRELLLWQEYANNSAKAETIIMPLPNGYKPTTDLYPAHKNKKHRWAMVIDLDKCIGCGACAIACYAENNIAVMGAEAVKKGREMAWMKVVPYKNENVKQEIGFLPMLCQHCDAAPCEPVCPVFAAVHNEEGLNSQIYNRCIGTRYCSNNCPYKVRKFNWFDTKWPEPLHLQLNPEVTVRCRGVMEKCTFCNQRIRSAELEAKMNGRELKDGEIQPACVQSCPADVFVFGDLMDENSRVSQKIKNDLRRYQVLRELNTKPAVFYLKKLKI